MRRKGILPLLNELYPWLVIVLMACFNLVLGGWSVYLSSRILENKWVQSNAPSWVLTEANKIGDIIFLLGMFLIALGVITIVQITRRDARTFLPVPVLEGQTLAGYAYCTVRKTVAYILMLVFPGLIAAFFASHIIMLAIRFYVGAAFALVISKWIILEYLSDSPLILSTGNSLCYASFRDFLTKWRTSDFR